MQVTARPATTYVVCQVEDILHKVLLEESPQNGAEDALNTLITELSKAQQVEVAQQPGRHWVASATWWPHSSHKLCIYDIPESARRLVLIPAPMVKPLAQQLQWWLCKVFFTLGHVEVIYKDDTTFASWRAIHSFAPLVHLGVCSMACSEGLTEVMLTEVEYNQDPTVKPLQGCVPTLLTDDVLGLVGACPSTEGHEDWLDLGRHPIQQLSCE